MIKNLIPSKCDSLKHNYVEKHKILLFPFILLFVRCYCRAGEVVVRLQRFNAAQPSIKKSADPNAASALTTRNFSCEFEVH